MIEMGSMVKRSGLRIARTLPTSLVKKKTLFIAVFISILLLSFVFGAPQVKVVKADPICEVCVNGQPIVNVYSPTNETYFSSNVLLNFSLTRPESADDWLTFTNQLDYFGSGTTLDLTGLVNRVLQVNVTLIGPSPSSSVNTIDVSNDLVVSNDSYLSSPFICYVPLRSLEDGSYQFKINMKCQGVIGGIGGPEDTSVVLFTYDDNSTAYYFNVDSNPPVIAVSPIENQTVSPVKNENYGKSSVFINFTVSKPTSQITYSLDGQDNVTIAGNTTLTDLPYGEHNVTVYATDLYGKVGASNTTFFTIAKSAKPAEPFPAVLVTSVAVSASAIAVSAVGLFYFKKRGNHNKTENPH